MRSLAFALIIASATADEERSAMLQLKSRASMRPAGMIDLNSEHGLVQTLMQVEKVVKKKDLDGAVAAKAEAPAETSEGATEEQATGDAAVQNLLQLEKTIKRKNLDGAVQAKAEETQTQEVTVVTTETSTEEAATPAAESGLLQLEKTIKRKNLDGAVAAKAEAEPQAEATTETSTEEAAPPASGLLQLEKTIKKKNLDGAVAAKEETATEATPEDSTEQTAESGEETMANLLQRNQKLISALMKIPKAQHLLKHTPVLKHLLTQQ
jgi:hypothetical protein